MGATVVVVRPGMVRTVRYYYTFIWAGFYNGISENHTIYGGIAFYTKHCF